MFWELGLSECFPNRFQASDLGLSFWCLSCFRPWSLYGWYLEDPLFDEDEGGQDADDFCSEALISPSALAIRSSSKSHSVWMAELRSLFRVSWVIPGLTASSKASLLMSMQFTELLKIWSERSRKQPEAAFVRRAEKAKALERDFTVSKHSSGRLCLCNIHKTDSISASI